MSLYNDLNEVLTPYANKIKELNGSLANAIAPNLAKDTTWTNGRQIMASSGNPASSETGAMSDYVDISGSTSIIYTRRCTNGTSAPNGGMAFYNTSKEYISGVKDGYKPGGDNPSLHEETVPGGAVYARFTYLRTDDENISDYPFAVYDGRIYNKSIAFKVDTNTDDIDEMSKFLKALSETAFELTGLKEYVTLENGKPSLNADPNAVQTNAIDILPGQTIEIFPVRPLTEGTHYRYTYRTYDADGASVTNNATAKVDYKKVTFSKTTIAKKIKFGIAVYDDSSGSVAETLRADTYGYNVYVIISAQETLKSVVETHLTEDTEDYLSQSRYSDTSNARILTLLHFTDNHENKKSAVKALEVFEHYTTKIDDIVHTGDTVLTKLPEGIQNWIDSGCANRVLNAVGNHDTYKTGGILSDYLLEATQEEVYNALFSPYISGWGVTQPTGVDDSSSDYYCACYYYKDYATKAIRLIVLDAVRWTAEELAWFETTLESARTNGYAVVVASHCVPGAVIPLANSNYNYVGHEGLTNPCPGYARITTAAADAIDTFVSNGGTFIVWLSGHYHRGGFGYVENHPNIFVMTAEKAGTAQTTGHARIAGEKNEYSFNIITFDPSDGYIRMVRYGADVDAWLRGRHVFCYDYINKRIVSQW